jgi:2-oxoacid:acceptor oxidoreductase delta subunit (pyruvate/2-ketoisovalerate family)
VATKGLTEITVWYRGITEGKISRDIVNSLAKAAENEGKYTQAFDNYVDLPDRVYVPCRSYARISDEPIAEPYLYENDHPAIIVAVEPTMVKGVPILRGLRKGGVLVVNTDEEPEELLKHMSDLDTSVIGAIATVRAGGGALEGALSGIEGALDVSGMGGGAAGPLAGAVARVSGIVDIASLEAVVVDPSGVRRGYDEVKVHWMGAESFDPAPAVEHGEHKMGEEVSLIIPAPTTENEAMITGNWRFLRPVVDKELCTQCKICFAFCPDSCITVADEGVDVNLKYCKGCGICWTECPVEGAITPVAELDFVGGVVRF